MGGSRNSTRKRAKIVKTHAGEDFLVEHPEKPWTHTRKYKNWVKKLTRKHKKNSSIEDLCAGRGSICKGDLGIPRKYMPQILKSEDVTRFKKFLKKTYKVKTRRTTLTARNLHPSQGEISRKRIQRIKNMIEREGLLDKVTVPLVVSKNNYILDGHHRWAAYRVKKPDYKLPVLQIDAPIKDILAMAVSWGSSYSDF
jgi:hypothetical protein